MISKRQGALLKLSVRCGYGLRVQRFERFRFSVLAVPLQTGFSVFQYSLLEGGKDPHPQDKIQHLDFTKDPRPLYYKTPPCVFYHNKFRSKAVFGP